MGCCWIYSDTYRILIITVKNPLEAPFGSVLWGLVWACCLTPLFFFLFFMRKVDGWISCWQNWLPLRGDKPELNKAQRTQTPQRHTCASPESAWLSQHIPTAKQKAFEQSKKDRKRGFKKKPFSTEIYKHMMTSQIPLHFKLMSQRFPSKCNINEQ